MHAARVDATPGAGGHEVAVTPEGGLQMHAGRKPKEDRSQVRHRIAVLDFDDIPDVPFDGPELPRRYRYEGGVERECAWPTPTIRWWAKIRTMPHAKRWTPTDWEFAFTTAEGHARFMEGKGSLTEIRARERRMGTTWEALRDMRIRYVAPSEATKREEEAAEQARPAAPVASVTRMDEFREMYGEGA